MSSDRKPYDDARNSEVRTQKILNQEDQSGAQWYQQQMPQGYTQQPNVLPQYQQPMGQGYPQQPSVPPQYQQQMPQSYPQQPNVPPQYQQPMGQGYPQQPNVPPQYQQYRRVDTRKVGEPAPVRGIPQFNIQNPQWVPASQPVPEPTPNPWSMPMPTPVPSSTAEPKPAPIPTPVPGPAPTPVPNPWCMPMPTPVPSHTAEPKPAPSPVPHPAPGPAFDGGNFKPHFTPIPMAEETAPVSEKSEVKQERNVDIPSQKKTEESSVQLEPKAEANESCQGGSISFLGGKLDFKIPTPGFARPTPKENTEISVPELASAPVEETPAIQPVSDGDSFMPTFTPIVEETYEEAPAPAQEEAVATQAVQSSNSFMPTFTPIVEETYEEATSSPVEEAPGPVQEAAAAQAVQSFNSFMPTFTPIVEETYEEATSSSVEETSGPVQEAAAAQAVQSFNSFIPTFTPIVEEISEEPAPSPVEEAPASAQEEAVAAQPVQSFSGFMPTFTPIVEEVDEETSTASFPNVNTSHSQSEPIIPTQVNAELKTNWKAVSSDREVQSKSGPNEAAITSQQEMDEEPEPTAVDNTHLPAWSNNPEDQEDTQVIFRTVTDMEHEQEQSIPQREETPYTSTPPIEQKKSNVFQSATDQTHPSVPAWAVNQTDRSSADLPIMIAFSIVAALYIFRGVGTVLGGTGNFIECIRWDYGVINLFMVLFSMLKGVFFGVMGIMVFSFGVQKDYAKRSVLLMGEVVSAAGIILISMIQVLLLIIAFGYFAGKLLIAMIIAALICGASFGVLFSQGGNPFGSNREMLSMQLLPGIVAESIRNVIGNVQGMVNQAAETCKQNQQTRAAATAAQAATAQVAQSVSQLSETSATQKFAARTADPVPTAGVVRLDTNRGIFLYVILTFLTCGLYSIYFIYKMAKDVNVACQGDGAQTPGLIRLIIFNLLTCGFYSIYWWYSLEERVYRNAPRYGLKITETGGNFLVWYLVGVLLCGIGSFVALHIVMKNVNAICAAYNRTNGLA